MRVKQHTKNDVLFTDYEVCVLLHGIVETKKHVRGSMVPVPLSGYGPGDILGFDVGDGGLTSHVETWSVCKGPVEAIYMNKDDFMEVWKLHDQCI